MSQEHKNESKIPEVPPGFKLEDYVFAQSVVILAGGVAEWFENRKARANLRKKLGLEKGSPKR